MKHLLFLVLSICCVMSTAQGAERHLFILSGQSNMDGLKADRDFTPEITRLLPGIQVTVVQDDERAQALRRWLPEWLEVAAKYGYKDKKPPKHPDGDLYARLLKAVKEQSSGKYDSVTFVWMQGESDAMVKGYAPVYLDAFSLLVKKLQQDVGAPKMNVVIGRLSDALGDDKPDWMSVREVQVAFANGYQHGAWVDTDDLNDKEKDGKMINDLHYTKEGYSLLGKRFARQAALLISGGKPVANGRPDANGRPE